MRDSEAPSFESGFPSGIRLRIDISLMQSALRDYCKSDVLLILDTCNAGFIPANFRLPLEMHEPKYKHTMETLAACAAACQTPLGQTLHHFGIYIHSFTQRLVGQMTLQHGNPAGVSVDRYNTLLSQDWRYREVRFVHVEDVQGYASANVRVLNTGDRSIVLKRLPKSVDSTERSAGSPMKRSDRAYTDPERLESLWSPSNGPDGGSVETSRISERPIRKKGIVLEPVRSHSNDVVRDSAETSTTSKLSIRPKEIKLKPYEHLLQLAR